MTPELLAQIHRHEASHQIRYCSCPCFEALLTFATEVKEDRNKFRRLAKHAPDTFAELYLMLTEEVTDGRIDQEQGDSGASVDGEQPSPSPHG